MKERDILSYTLEKLKAKGMDASCSLDQSTKYEMNVETGKITLIRTVFNNGLSLYAIKDSKSGSYSVNKLDRETIDEAISTVIEIAESSEPDPAHAIAEYQPSGAFSAGSREPDQELMYTRLEAFLDQVRTKYPKIMLENAYFDFTHGTRYIANTNGTDFTTEKGIYRFTSMFSGHDGDQSSSFNYTGYSTQELDRELLAYGSLESLLKQSSEQITTQALSGKFVGDVVITPDCLSDFLGYVFGITIYDGALISGTSVYKDKLGHQVADPRLVIHSRPVSPEVPDGYFITGDGYRAENCTIIDRGILKTFLLTLYGANKTGLKRAVNNGGCYVVEPGDKPLDEIISQIERGILIARYSGNYPSQNGDFSGVAKNSYYIENGKIQYPISETMVSGNLISMLQNIIDISQERVSFGSGIYPWIAFSEVTISGK
ncbi:MAG: TldD/PmbA family protein [Firmicutes bacterium]|nr:TldD/PmbA family protein [Bacillota bacterium]NLL87975.1 TldD/PmbA family protein [Bacillota bacterium]HKM17236.1 TldD/PmbA family protein [Limnochordia bacterium]